VVYSDGVVCIDRGIGWRQTTTQPKDKDRQAGRQHMVVVVMVVRAIHR